MNRRIIAIASILALIGIVALGAVYFFAKADWSGEITGFNWWREWDIERYQVINDRCWSDGCQPSRSYDIERRREIRSYRSVKDGETCTGTGDDRRCTPRYRQEAVYGTRIYYTVNDWRVVRVARSSGIGNRDVYWPQLVMSSCDSELQPSTGDNDPLLGCERAGSQREQYSVSIQPIAQDVNAIECPVSYGRWSDMLTGFNVSGSYWIHQHLIDCGSLKWE